jgi:hypothetical protein
MPMRHPASRFTDSFEFDLDPATLDKRMKLTIYSNHLYRYE